MVTGHFSIGTSKQIPEVLHAFRTETLPFLFSPLSISTSKGLRLLTDVTTIACLSQILPYHSPFPITCQDLHLSPRHMHPMLHLSQLYPVLCNHFCKIIRMSPPAISAITSNLSAIFMLRLFVSKYSHWSHVIIIIFLDVLSQENQPFLTLASFT